MGFKVGDRVKIIRSNNANGMIAEIKDVLNGSGYYVSSVKQHGFYDPNRKYWFAERELELIEDTKPKFKVGDQVKIKSNDSYNGETGVIQRHHHSVDGGDAYSVRLVNCAGMYEFEENELEKHDAKPKRAKTEDNYDCQRNDGAGIPCDICGAESDKKELSWRDLQHIDRVTVTDEKGNIFRGRVYHVYDWNDKIGVDIVGVNGTSLRIGDASKVTLSDLEREPEKKELSWRDLQVGDWITVTDIDGRTFRGDVDYVDGIAARVCLPAGGGFFVKDATSSYYKLSDLKRVKKVKE